MRDFKLMGLPLPIFAVVSVVILAGVFTGTLPSGMVGAFALLLFLGAVFGWIGDNTPIVKTYLGGGAIVIIFVSAALVHYEVLPSNVVLMIKNFMESGTLKGAEGATVGFNQVS